MKRLLILGLSVAFFAACGEVPTGPDGLAPDFGVAGNSGCYTVNFTVDLLATSPATFDGTVTGDLEGTNYVQFITVPVITGVKTKAKALVTWHITDGITGPLEFVTLANGGFTADPNNPDVVTIHSTERAVPGTGVRIANLNDSGAFTAYGALLEYRGVICP